MTSNTVALSSSHHRYYNIARSNLDIGREKERELEANEIRYAEWEQDALRATGRPDPDDASIATMRRVQLLEQRCVSLIQVCVFAGMAAEAFINFYPRWKSQPNSLLDAVENLSLESKWLVTPALINGGQRLNPGEQPMQDLRFLVSTRNKLVHGTPRAAVLIQDGTFIMPQERIDDHYGPSLSDAEHCVHTVRRLVLALRNIDPAISTDWLDDEFIAPFYPVQL